MAKGLFQGDPRSSLIYANALAPLAAIPGDVFQGIMQSRKQTLAEEEGRRRENQRRFLREEVAKQEWLAAEAAGREAQAPTAARGTTRGTGTRGAGAAQAPPKIYTDKEGVRHISDARIGKGFGSADKLTQEMFRDPEGVRKQHELNKEIAALMKTEEALAEAKAEAKAEDAKKAAAKKEEKDPVSELLAGKKAGPPARGEFKAEREALPEGEEVPSYTSPSDWTDPSFGTEKISRGRRRELRKEGVPKDWIKETFTKPFGAHAPGVRAPDTPLDLEVFEDPYEEFFPEGGGPQGDEHASELMEASTRHAREFPGQKLGSAANERQAKMAVYAGKLRDGAKAAEAAMYEEARDVLIEQEARGKEEWVENLVPVLRKTYNYKTGQATSLAELWYENPTAAKAISGNRSSQIQSSITASPKLKQLQQRADAAEVVEDSRAKELNQGDLDVFNEHAANDTTALKGAVSKVKEDLLRSERAYNKQVDAMQRDKGINPEGFEGERFLRWMRDYSAREPKGAPADLPAIQRRDKFKAFNTARDAYEADSDELRGLQITNSVWEQERADLSRGEDTTRKVYTVTIDRDDGTTETVSVPSFSSGKREAAGFAEPNVAGESLGVSQLVAELYSDRQANDAAGALAGAYVSAGVSPPRVPAKREPLYEKLSAEEVGYAVDLDLRIREKSTAGSGTVSDEAKETMVESWEGKTAKQQGARLKFLESQAVRYKIAGMPRRPGARRTGGGALGPRAGGGSGGVPEEYKVDALDTNFGLEAWYEVAYRAGYRPEEKSNPKGMWVDHSGQEAPQTAEEAERVFGGMSGGR